MGGSKTCEHCGENFGRNPKFSQRQWDAARFCSRGCAIRWRAARRPDARRRCLDCGTLDLLIKDRCRSCYAAWRWATDPAWRARRDAQNKAWSGRHPDYARARYLRDRDKIVARIAAGRAVRQGRLMRERCEICGGEAEMHHEDYTKPLEVRWLCRRHHRALHRNALSIR